MNTKFRLLLVQVLVIILAAGLFTPQTGTGASSGPIPNRVLAHALDLELGRVHRRTNEPLLSSGVVYALLQASGELDRRASTVRGTTPPTPRAKTQGCQNNFTGHGDINTRVNQDCSFRRQAEEVIAVNPTNPNNLIAGQNDSRIGFNHCGYDFSFDGGKTWGDLIPPFYQFQLLDGHTADACSDPTATFDSLGNAYIGGILFDVAANDSAFVVEKSNAPIGGAFYHTPDSSVSFQTYATLPLGVVANDNYPNIFRDKEFIVADANPASPKHDNVYATWTRFNFDTGAGIGVNSPIYFSQSTDGGATWSAGIEISGANTTFCTAFSGESNPNACDQDQGSHPIVGPDGTIYVGFGNGNTPVSGVNQHMIVSCPPTADCSQQASWTTPVKTADDYSTQPVASITDPVTGCPAFRQCLPPNGYRMDDFVEGSISVDNHGILYAVWADFRNGNTNTPNCTGDYSTATSPCDNDVFYAFSTDHGATWSAPVDITPASRFGFTAQWQPWSAVQPNGNMLFVAYYDRSYGDCESTGCNDITLAVIRHPASGAPAFTYKRLTTASMPNLVVANNPYEAGFLGDYMWVTVDPSGKPYVVWADTRGQDGAVEEDIYLSRP